MTHSPVQLGSALAGLYMCDRFGRLTHLCWLSGGTRTCIHTPVEPLLPQEMTQERVAAALRGATLVYFDGCLTEAALVVARAARAKGIKVLKCPVVLLQLLDMTCTEQIIIRTCWVLQCHE